MTILRSLFILGLLIFLSPMVFQDAQASPGTHVSESSCVMINGDTTTSKISLGGDNETVSKEGEKI